VVFTSMFVPVIRKKVMVLSSAVHGCHRASFGLLRCGQPGVNLRLLQVMARAFLSHNWPGVRLCKGWNCDITEAEQ